MNRLGKNSIVRSIATLTLTVSIAGCGTTGLRPDHPSPATDRPSAFPTGVPAGELATGVTPSALATTSAEAGSAPPPIQPGTVQASAALKLAWKGVDPGGTAPPSVGQVTIAPDGRIWVSATKLDRFWIFDSSGRFLESWGSTGAGDGQFDFARDASDSFGAVAFAPDGSMFVADTGNRRIEHFDRDRRFVAAFGSFGTGDGQFVSPEAIAVSPSSHVFIVDGERSITQEFASDGTFVRAFGPDHGPTLGMTAGGDVLLVDQTSHRLDEYTNGAIVRSIDLNGIVAFGNGIEVDQAGDIWVASELDGDTTPKADHLIELNRAGKLTHMWPVAAESIAVDPLHPRLYASFVPQPYLAAYDIPGL